MHKKPTVCSADPGVSPGQGLLHSKTQGVKISIGKNYSSERGK